MMRILACIGILLLCSGNQSWAQDGPAFRVSLFPSEAYLAEPVTFAFKGRKGVRIKVTLNQKEIATAAFDRTVLEFNLALRESGKLTFSDGRSQYTFDLVLPSDSKKLSLREGVFYTGKAPAILLLHHRHPPKHNRRWEVIHILDSMFRDTRPAVKSVTVLGPLQLTQRDLQQIQQLSKAKAGFWKTMRSQGDCIYELDAIIASNVTTAEAVLIYLTGNDLRRGMKLLRFRMRLEWILQRLNAVKHIYVLSLPFDSKANKMFPRVSREIKLAARGNRARYVVVADSGTVPERVHKALTHVEREVKFK